MYNQVIFIKAHLDSCIIVRSVIIEFSLLLVTSIASTSEPLRCVLPCLYLYLQSDCLLIQTKEMSVNPSDAARIFGSESYESAVGQG